MVGIAHGYRDLRSSYAYCTLEGGIDSASTYCVRLLRELLTPHLRQVVNLLRRRVIWQVLSPTRNILLDLRLDR